MKFSMKPVAAAALAVVLTACGGGSDDSPVITAMESADRPAEILELPAAQPAFHRMPLELDEPTDSSEPTVVQLTANMMTVKTARLIDTVDSRRRTLAAGAAPAATTTPAMVYTPAQIRAAYGMKPVRESTAEELGAGQTIYIIGAFNNPNLLTDLARFNTRFGLPQCREVKIPVGTTRLAPANPADGCTISVVYSTLGPKISATPPAYNRTWAVESALDVQWAHATAPLARIVVFESLNNFVNSFADALQLANSFGPGAVSMSWVAGEQTYTERYEVFFKGTGMTYFAAAGDLGSQANWPATSPSVIAVGGTSLRVTAAGREETVWSKTGGGYSAYFAAPTYQTATVRAEGRTGKFSTRPNQPARASTDVAMNSDPMTGHYVVFTPKDGQPLWYSYGGTSIATPQWAGITAMVNARRAALGRAPIGRFHEALYRTYGPSVGAFSQTFTDVRTGSNGTCLTCQAQWSWDLPSGWGTPNVTVLVNNLAGS